MTDCLVLERVHERGLAYARFARYEDHLSLAAQRVLQKTVQHGESLLPPHHIARGLRRRSQTGRCAVVRYGSYKLVAPLRERPNECRLIGPIAQHLPDLQDVLADAFR